MSDLNFESLDPISVPVALGGKQYIIKELMGGDAATYRDAMLEATDITFKDGKVSPARLRGMSKTDMLLLSLTLFEAGTNQRVPMEVISAWPDRVVRKLVDKAKEVSELNAPADGENPTLSEGL